MSTLSKALWSDLKTDEERSNWFLLGRGVETGVIAPALQAELSLVFSHRAKLERELAEAKGESTALVHCKSGESRALDRLEVVAAERDQLRAEVERLRSEIGPLREIVGVRCDAESNPSDIINWMNLVSHADAAKKLRARVAELEAQLNSMRLICGTTDANKFQTALDRANEKAAELEQDKARLIDVLKSQEEWWAQNPSGVDHEANETNASPEDAVAHIAGLATREIRAAIDAAMKGAQ